MVFPVVPDSEQIGFVDCRYDRQDPFVYISEIDTEHNMMLIIPISNYGGWQAKRVQ